MQIFGNVLHLHFFTFLQIRVWAGERNVRNENFIFDPSSEGGEKIGSPLKRRSKMALRPLPPMTSRFLSCTCKAEVISYLRELSFTSLVRPSKCLVGLIRPRVRLQTQLNANVLAWRITIVSHRTRFNFLRHCDRVRSRIDITISP